VKPAVLDGDQLHRMVIVNGSQPAVRYVGGQQLSTADQASLRELERAESDVALADRLQKYRVEVIEQEVASEAQRRDMRSNLMRAAMSTATTVTTQNFAESYAPRLETYPPLGGLSYPFGSYAAANPAYGFGPISVAASYGGYGLGYGGYGGYAGYAGYGGNGGYAPQAVHTRALVAPTELLAELSKDDGNSKALQAMLQSAPADAQKAEANYLAALNRVNQSDTLRTAMGGQAAKAKSNIVLAGIPDVAMGAGVKVTYKAGDRVDTVEGNLVNDGAEFLTIRTTGGRMSIAKSQIQSVLVKD
jgi:hypothetical protein